MVNKIIIALFLLVIVFVIANKKISSPIIFDAVNQNISDQNNANITEAIPITSKNITNKSQKEDFYLSFVECGTNKEQFLSAIDAILENADQAFLEAIDQKLDLCENWFDHLSSLNPSDLEKLIKKQKDRSDFIISLASLEINDNTFNAAINALIKHDDPYLSSLSLEYLLRFDSDFKTKLADEMNVKDINSLIRNEKLIFLYQCYAGEDCTANGQFMQDLCQIDPVTCGLSYPELVRQEVTPNQFDDFILVINSVNTIINSDWFKKRDILSPINS